MHICKCFLHLHLDRAPLIISSKGAVAKYCEFCDEYISVCVHMCLSVCEDISGTTCMIFTKFLCMLPMAMAWSFWRHCDTLCTSGFVDDIRFFIVGCIVI